MRTRVLGLVATSWALAFAFALAFACGGGYGAAPEPDGVDAASPGPPTDSGGADATGDADAGQATDAIADAEPDSASPCGSVIPMIEVVGAPEADGLIAVNSTQAFGGLSLCSMAVGRCLFRFAPSQEALGALAAGRVLSMTLTLRRADTDPNCSGSCTGLRDDGTLTAYPVRTDWTESQMTWFLRQTGASWGGSGASLVGTDVGSLAATRDAAATDVTVAVDLDPRVWKSSAFPPDGGKVGVVTEFFNAGGTRGQFVVVTHEPGATPAQPAKLEITYCL